jgi:ABC-type transport system substrate-binding protein
MLGGAPRINRLVIAVVDEPTTKLAALTVGELDFAGIQPAHAEFVRRDPGLAVVTYPLLLTYAVVFNTRRPPLDDVRVRRAISLAIDRTAIVNGYLFGFGAAITGPIPDSSGARPPVPDTASARRLLGGRSIHLELLTVGSGEAALEQMLQSQLAAIGVQVTIRQLELTSFLDRVQGRAHEFDAAVLGIPGDLGLGQLAPLLNTAGVPHADDQGAMLRTIADSMPAAFLYQAGGVQGMNRRVHGVRMDVRGELASLRDWYVDR